MTSSTRSQVAALVATRERPELLARCLGSISAQTRRADFVIVVVDGDATSALAIAEIARTHVDAATILCNARTQGAAGAWNTGLSWLHEHVGDPNATFVAIIDDDDEWDAGHVAACLDAAARDDLDLVVSGLIRHDDRAVGGRCQRIPDSIDEAAMLVGNPHVQGSNLFVRLSVVLEAGLFDEGLPSTTDRDLLLRILDLGHVRLGSTTVHTVLQGALGLPSIGHVDLIAWEHWKDTHSE